MTITNQDIKLYRGDTATLFVSLNMADGQPFDPTINATFKWRMSANWHTPESEALVRKELGSGIALATGGVNIALVSADSDFAPGLYYHELKVFDTGDVTTAMTGTVVIKRSVRMGDSSEPAAAVITLQGNIPVAA